MVDEVVILDDPCETHTPWILSGAGTKAANNSGITGNCVQLTANAAGTATMRKSFSLLPRMKAILVEGWIYWSDFTDITAELRLEVILKTRSLSQSVRYRYVDGADRRYESSMESAPGWNQMSDDISFQNYVWRRFGILLDLTTGNTIYSVAGILKTHGLGLPAAVGGILTNRTNEFDVLWELANANVGATRLIRVDNVRVTGMLYDEMDVSP